MNKIKLIIAGLLLVPVVALAAAAPVGAQGLTDALSDVKTDDLVDVQPNDLGTTVQTVVNFLLWLIGILSVIMIIFGGIKYTTSGGDSGKLTSAKNTIIYSVIGLLVAIFAYAIVNLVIAQTKSAKTAAASSSGKLDLS